MNLNNIFIQVSILFILIIVGYMARSKNLIDEISTSHLSSLVLNIFLPSMIINSMQIDYQPSMINKIFLLIVISLFMYFMSFLIAYISKFILKHDKDLGIYQYVIIFSNVGFMGYPVVEAVLGKDAIFYTAIFNLPFNLFAFTLGTYLLTKDNNSGYSFSLKSLMNPIIFSILLGLMLFLFRIKLPVFINDSLNMLGSVTTPISMIAIGSLLKESSATECFTNKKLYFVTFIRLIFTPVLVFVVLKNFITDPLILSIPVVISSMPAAANTAIMASEFNANKSLASQSVFFTTLFSVLTIPLISILILA